MTTAETFRAREVYRYYQPRNSKENVSAAGAHSIDGVAAQDYGINVTQTGSTNFTTQTSFSDTALTAFAQLIALRLDAQRAIVSLIDHENEYFLAESTSTLSLIDDDSPDGDAPAQNGRLSISGARVPRRASLCEQTLYLVPNGDTMAEKFLVADLRLDEKLRHLDCVKGPPYLRFYCGVALKNKKGINIGCVYVVDDRPRDNVTLEQAQFLFRMSATIMDHLEGIRAKEDIVRVTMMSQALHAFIEGDGTMDGDWQRLKRYNLPSGAGVGFSWETKKNDGTGRYANGEKQLGSSRHQASFSGLESDLSPQQSPLQHTKNTPDARFNFNNSPWSSSSELPSVQPFKSVFEGVEDASAALEGHEGGRDTEFSNDGFSNLLHSTFSRASNLVREGMEVDGAVFFDAPYRFYQGRSTLESDPRRSDSTESDDETDSDSDAGYEEDNEDSEAHAEPRPGPHPHVIPSHKSKGTNSRRVDSLKPPVTTDTMGLKADILGFSCRGLSSWKNKTIRPTTFSAIDQSLLTSFVKRYPQGQLFEFDENGPITPEFDDPQDSQSTIITMRLEAKKIRQRARKRAEILRLLVAFPGARHIAFVPLYDSTSGCFIGSFAWSTSATRLFSIDNHLSYLIAFGHSVMSEVSRLNTLSSDRAKGDFISNVSHELRSPLHGILASVEFLADNSKENILLFIPPETETLIHVAHLDGFQRNLVDTVDICGRTLLDTIEHVLDFSKIKRFGQESSQSMGVVADLDVSAVIEEVVEGVYSGFEFNGLSSEGLADRTRSGTRDPPAKGIVPPADELSHGSDDPVVVIIDIDFREQWKFPAAPGTLKRLAMNVFGNALKYTHSGFITVKLEARPISAPVSAKGARERTMVTLTITDSGQGMSSEFMKTKLFMPFSQEDSTAPGTGLGMSIVKQIVDLSGGRIDVRSDQLSGTEVKLSLPLDNCLPKSELLPINVGLPRGIEDPIDAVRRRAGGRNIHIQGFKSAPGRSKVQREALENLKKSIAKFATQWLHLKLVSGHEDADIAISDETSYQNSYSRLSRHKILLILCDNKSRRSLYPSNGQIVEVVSKPCGPHRLAKALLNCLDTEDATPRVTQRERVSALTPRSRETPSEDSTEAAGASNVRLIGDLQSSIGFSPAVISLIRYEGPQTTFNADALRPSLSPRSSSSGSLKTSNAIAVPINLPSPAESPDEPIIFLEPRCPLIKANYTERRQPKMLLVEDNPINMMLLATYMKKNKWEFEQASNGLLALQAFRESPEGFDVIFMDVSMPVMTGYESTRHIRTVETERRLAYEHQNLIQTHSVPANLTSFPFNTQINQLVVNTPSAFSPVELEMLSSAPRLHLNHPALIIALTGFSSEKDQQLAFESGVDIFMTKPVRFREVGKILEGWMKSRDERMKEERLA